MSIIKEEKQSILCRFTVLEETLFTVLDDLGSDEEWAFQVVRL